MKSVSILAHLNAGGSHGRGAVAKLQAACNKQNIAYKLYISKYPKHTPKLIQEIVAENKNNNYNRIVVVGGDGTLNEAISGLVELKNSEPISYFPSGTGNDFARSLSLTNDEDKFITNLFSTEVTELEFIKAEDRYNDIDFVALNGLGIGFDALIANLNDKNKNSYNKVKLGQLSYLSKIIDAFKKRETYSAEIIVNNKVYKFENILFSSFMKNCYFGGGIKIDPFSAKNNGEIGLVLAHHIKVRDIIKLLPHILFTGNHFDKSDKLTRISGEEFVIKIKEQQFIQADGEVSRLDNINLKLQLQKYPFYLVEK